MGVRENQQGTLAGFWADFERDVIPRGASLAQRVEMQRAFYAGARLVMVALDVIAESRVSESAGVEMLADLKRECEDFSQRIGADF